MISTSRRDVEVTGCNCPHASTGAWRPVYRIFFLSAATYAVASNLINVAIDLGEYYTGSLYDVPLIAAMVAISVSVWRVVHFSNPRLQPESAKGKSRNLTGRSHFFPRIWP